VLDIGAPMDVLWFRMSRLPSDPGESMGNFGKGAIFVMINRGDYWQCGYVIAKDSLAQARQRGSEVPPGYRAWRPMKGRTQRSGFDDLRLLTVGVDRLKRWHRPGLLCIGDAAHAMSPIGGVGINLASQDAVAAANLLAAPLRRGAVTDADLRSVQERREPPTRKTQAMQVFLQKNVITAVLGSAEQLKPPLFLKMARFPGSPDPRAHPGLIRPEMWIWRDRWERRVGATAQRSPCPGGRMSTAFSGCDGAGTGMLNHTGAASCSPSSASLTSWGEAIISETERYFARLEKRTSVGLVVGAANAAANFLATDRRRIVGMDQAGRRL
jgi:hypothetical protein